MVTGSGQINRLGKGLNWSSGKLTWPNGAFSPSARVALPLLCLHIMDCRRCGLNLLPPDAYVRWNFFCSRCKTPVTRWGRRLSTGAFIFGLALPILGGLRFLLLANPQKLHQAGGSSTFPGLWVASMNYLLERFSLSTASVLLIVEATVIGYFGARLFRGLWFMFVMRPVGTKPEETPEGRNFDRATPVERRLFLYGKKRLTFEEQEGLSRRFLHCPSCRLGYYVNCDPNETKFSYNCVECGTLVLFWKVGDTVTLISDGPQG